MKSSSSTTRIDTIIFDFDGVIADSGAIFTEALEAALNRAIPFSKSEIEQMRNSSPREVIKILGLKKWQVPLVIARGKKGVAARMHKVKVFKGMPEALKELHYQGFTLYILSTNSAEAITAILDQHGMSQYVARIYSGARVFGKAKRLKAFLRKEGLRKDQCVYVGDEVRDVEATKQIGMKCIAVEWGYSSPAALKSYKPEALAKRPADLLSKLPSLNG